MLKASVTDLSAVDPAHAAFYKEENGKYVLNVTAADGYALENTTGLRNALTAARSERDSYKTQLTAFDGINPVEAKTAFEKIAAFGSITPDQAKQGVTALDRLSKFDPEKEADKLAEEKVKNAKTQLVASFEAEKLALKTELTSATEKLSKRDGQVAKILKQNTISTELLKLNPLDEARDVLELLTASAVQLKEVNGEYVPVVTDENGNPRTKIDASYHSVPVTVAEFLAEMKEKRPSLFKAENRSGIDLPTGGRPATGNAAGVKNPWATGSINLTEQALLTKNEPTLAARFMQEAGVA